jgi:predicted RND superfamily exporter protein
LTSLLGGFPTLRSPNTDLELAASELTKSPFFRELLVTKDGDATAIKIDLFATPELNVIEDAIEQARSHDSSELELLKSELRQQKIQNQQRQEQLIADVRAVKLRYQHTGTLYLGGVPMIATDMITYVRNDLRVFGGVVVILMIIALGLFFRRPRWVYLALLTATIGVVARVSLLEFMNWQVTVISSNFIALLGITTISLTIHLIVHYRELRLLDPDMDGQRIVFETVRAKFNPCLYTAITTIAAFRSLTVCGIAPVADFGWMMCIGIVVAFMATMTVFPACLLLLKKGNAAANLGSTNNFIRWLGELDRWWPGTLTMGCVLVGGLAVWGISLVSLDNRFAEYFDDDTEIYQGMHYIHSHFRRLSSSGSHHSPWQSEHRCR